MDTWFLQYVIRIVHLNSCTHSDSDTFPAWLNRSGNLSVLFASFVYRSSKMYLVPFDHAFRNAIWDRVHVLSTPSLPCDIANLGYVCMCTKNKAEIFHQFAHSCMYMTNSDLQFGCGFQLHNIAHICVKQKEQQFVFIFIQWQFWHLFSNRCVYQILWYYGKVYILWPNQTERCENAID